MRNCIDSLDWRQHIGQSPSMSENDIDNRIRFHCNKSKRQRDVVRSYCQIENVGGGYTIFIQIDYSFLYRS